MANIEYPSAEKIIEYNVFVLKLIKVKKADQPKILSQQKIINVIDKVKETKGDVYDKAVILIKGIIQSHAFASGNRRTAFIVTKEFLIKNKKAFNVPDNPSQAKVMQGIRENHYKDEEIKEWLKNGKIKEFKRW